MTKKRKEIETTQALPEFLIFQNINSNSSNNIILVAKSQIRTAGIYDLLMQTDLSGIMLLTFHIPKYISQPNCSKWTSNKHSNGQRITPNATHSTENNKRQKNIPATPIQNRNRTVQNSNSKFKLYNSNQTAQPETEPMGPSPQFLLIKD